MRLLGSYVAGFDSGSAHYHCSGCGHDLTVSAVPGTGDGAVSAFDCECGGVAILRAVLHGDAAPAAAP